MLSGLKLLGDEAVVHRLRGRSNDRNGAKGAPDNSAAKSVGVERFGYSTKLTI